MSTISKQIFIGCLVLSYFRNCNVFIFTHNLHMYVVSKLVFINSIQHAYSFSPIQMSSIILLKPYSLTTDLHRIARQQRRQSQPQLGPSIHAENQQISGVHEKTYKISTKPLFQERPRPEPQLSLNVGRRKIACHLFQHYQRRASLLKQNNLKYKIYQMFLASFLIFFITSHKLMIRQRMA